MKSKSKRDALLRSQPTDQSLAKPKHSAGPTIEQPLVRGEREPAVIVMPDASVRLALMQHMTELGDGGHE